MAALMSVIIGLKDYVNHYFDFLNYFSQFPLNIFLLYAILYL